MHRRTLLMTAGAAALALPGAAQPVWPSRPVRVVVPFPPGGSNDAVARPLAEALARVLGQPFVVDNRGGAGGTIGAAEVARAPADGHTLLVTSSTFATSAAVQTTPYDAARGFETVAVIAVAPLLMLASPTFPPNTMAEAVAYIRARPGTVNYGSAGPGSIGHMAGALFAVRAGRLDMAHVPYRGTGPVMNDMVAGTVELTFTSLPAAAGLLNAGRLKLLGWTAAAPPGGPAAPTPAQSGIPDYEATIWWGVLARRGIPDAVRRRLNAAVRAAVTEERFAAALAAEGAIPGGLSPAEADLYVLDDLARWREVGQGANIRVE
jgi:tripartite-type tricarboxylate transporter receptor subunit TctC